MSETILVILILVMTASLLNIDKTFNGWKKSPLPDEEGAEKRTVDLIGEDAYEEMNRRVEAILTRHSQQPCISMKLTCGPDSPEGAAELHRLLPGQPLQMMICREEGVDCVDVYSNGKRIGRLALNEADMVFNYMKDNHLSAAYVAEQNCYGMENVCDMRIIAFLSPRKEAKGKIAVTGCEKTRIDFCQN